MVSFHVFTLLLSEGWGLLMVFFGASLYLGCAKRCRGHALVKLADQGDEAAFDELMHYDLDGRMGMFSAVEGGHRFGGAGEHETVHHWYPPYSFVQKYEAVIERAERVLSDELTRCGSARTKDALESKLAQLKKLRQDVRAFGNQQHLLPR